MASSDLVPLERRLHDLLQSLRTSKSDDSSSWLSVKTAAEHIANTLRHRNTEVDHHTILGKTDLPQTLTSLLALALESSPIPTEDKTAVVNELLRVGANLCMDHDENRAVLLETRFPQAVVDLLEAYAETIPSPTLEPLPLTIANLGIIRTCVGVLLNASLNFDSVKFHLISLQAAVTIIKLSAVIYPPTAWTALQHNSGFADEWSIRSQISSWVWRTVSILKDVQDDSLHIVTGEVIHWITPSLLKYCPPQTSKTSHLGETDPDFLSTLVQADFVFLEETCTLIESFALDVEDFRLELARATCYPEKDKSVQCLHALVKFIEEGSYPLLWKDSAFQESERKAWEKRFDNCKGALIKAFVEVFGEEKNEDVLWESGNQAKPGGDLVATMVEWIKNYGSKPKLDQSFAIIRDDMTICASLSLGNLARKASVAEALLSSPYSLAPVLASEQFLSPSTDLKLKHGILGLLKHIAQFSKASQVIPQTLGEVDIISKISDSGIWDEKTDAMASIIQLNAIGVAKHLCNGSLGQTSRLVLSVDKESTGFSQILALIKRSDSIPIKSEGSRVVVNVVKSLWLLERDKELSLDIQKNRDRAISYLVNPECVGILAALIARSNRYPILVNEGLVAMTLLSTHKEGGPLVLEALFTSINQGVSPVTTSSSPNDPASSLPTPSSVNDGLPVPKNALDMLIYTLRNVDNPVNFPMEVRVNVCTFLLQLQKNVPSDGFARVKTIVLPVAQQVVDELQDEPQEEKIFKAASLLVRSWGSA